MKATETFPCGLASAEQGRLASNMVCLGLVVLGFTGLNPKPLKTPKQQGHIFQMQVARLVFFWNAMAKSRALSEHSIPAQSDR